MQRGDSWMSSRVGRPQSASEAQQRPAPTAAINLVRHDFGVFGPGYADQAKEGFKPRTDLAAIRIAPPIDWAMDPYGDRNWSFQLQAWRMLNPVWGEFYGHDWGRLKAEILPWILDWHAYHVVQGRVSPFSWYDMATGLRAQHLALVVHLHQQGLMPLDVAEMDVVRTLSIMHMDRLRSPGFIAMNNHGLFQVRGLRLLGVVWAGASFVDGEPAFSALAMKRLMTTQFDGHGMHVENSPDYHGLITREFAEIRPELFPGIEGQLKRTLRRAREILPWFTFPDQSIANIGDSAGTSKHLSPKAKPDHVITTAVGECWVRDMSQSGYVVVRSKPGAPEEFSSMLVVKGQAMSQTHAHADHLGMVLYHGGRHLLVDSGKYTYNRDSWRDYFTSDRAHNVVGLSGGFGPQHTTTVGPGLDAVSVADGVVSIAGEVVRRKFFRHRRRIAFRPGQSLEVFDEIDARPGDKPVAYWHLAPGVDAERIAGGVALFDNGTCLARLRVLDPDLKPRLVHGQLEPRIQGWFSKGYGIKEAATVVEFRAFPGCKRIVTQVELIQPASRQANRLPRRLCHGVRLPFPFVFRSDRVLVLPDGCTRRELTVEVPGADPLSTAIRVSDALQAKEFRVEESSSSAELHAVELTHEDRTQATVRVYTATSSKPVRLILAWGKTPRSIKPGQLEGKGD